MIIYATKQTVDRLKLKMPEEIGEVARRTVALDILLEEGGDPMLEWGAKLFYFDRRKCLQVIHFASRLTIVLADIKVKDTPMIPQSLAGYLFDLYADDAQMQALTRRLVLSHDLFVYSRLKDRSMISQLNTTQRDYLYDGDRLYDYISDGMLHVHHLNRAFNWGYIPGGKTPDGRADYRYPGERFCEMLKAYYRER